MKIDGKEFGPNWDIVRVGNAVLYFFMHGQGGHTLVLSRGAAWCADCARVWYDELAEVER